MTATPDKLTVSSWLKDLRMECYKKQLEDFDTIKVSGVYLLAVSELSKSNGYLLHREETIIIMLIIYNNKNYCILALLVYHALVLCMSEVHNNIYTYTDPMS